MADDTPKTARVVLVRHAVTGETGSVLSGRQPGIDLSEDGRRQAKVLGERLSRFPIAAVYSSPIERTWQTAAAVAERHGVDVRRLDGVVEADYGDWTGEKLSELAKTDLWRVVQSAPSRATFPGGESIRAMQARAVDAVEGVADAHRGETVVVVSHSDVIKAVLSHYAGSHLDQFQRLVVSPASVSVVALGSGAPVVLSVNDTDGLDVLAPPPDQSEQSDREREGGDGGSGDGSGAAGAGKAGS